MILAKNKNGQIGRMIPSVGFDAQVETAQMGERRGSVYVSARSIQEDQDYYAQKDAEARGMAEAQKLKNIVEKNAQRIKAEQHHQNQEAFRKIAAIDPMNEKLRRHYTKMGAMGETQRVLNSVADFSQSGGNPEFVSGEVLAPGGQEWGADFRTLRIVGNPLTRDGAFGPAITDYERYVQGIDVHQENMVDYPVAGGTMYGRENGEDLQNRETQMDSSANMAGMGQMNGMGDWWDDLSDSFTSGITKGAGDVSATLPKTLLDQLLPGQTVKTGGNTATVYNPVPNVTTSYLPSQMPKWAMPVMIGAGALIGLLVVVKLVKA